MIDPDRYESSSRAGDAREEPLVGRGLPEPRPGEDDPYWDRAAARVMARLEPVLTVREARNGTRGTSWVSELGARWRAAALVAAAAVATLVAVGIQDRSQSPRRPEAGDLALALVASAGDPVLLWERLGMEADPVLAWLTFDGIEP